MDASYHRHDIHDINDKVWELLEPHLPGQRGQWGRIAQDNRRFINEVFWVLRTGAPWRDLPPDYGKWGSIHQRFIRWRRKGILEKLLEILIDEPDDEWLMIDASHITVHPHAAGAKGGNQDMSRTKGGLNTKIHLAVDAHGMPVRILITEGTRADCKEAVHLIEGISAETLLADRGYDTNDILSYAVSAGMEPVIPPKKNGKEWPGVKFCVNEIRQSQEEMRWKVHWWRAESLGHTGR